MQHVDDRIEAFVAGELDETERRVVTDHLAVCPVCADRMARTQRVWDLLADVEEPPRSFSAWSVIRARTVGHGGGSNLYGRKRWTQVVVASVALAAGLALAILMPIRPNDQAQLTVSEDSSWGSSFWLDEQTGTTFSELWLAAVDEGSGS